MVAGRRFFCKINYSAILIWVYSTPRKKPSGKKTIYIFYCSKNNLNTLRAELKLPALSDFGCQQTTFS